MTTAKRFKDLISLRVPAPPSLKSGLIIPPATNLEYGKMQLNGFTLCRISSLKVTTVHSRNPFQDSGIGKKNVERLSNHRHWITLHNWK
jgi:hypothetical protein